MTTLKQKIREMARRMGVDKVGFTSKDRLDDALPSGNLSYVLPNARSAISLAIAFDKATIRAYLAKKDQKAHLRDHAASYIKLGKVATAIQNLLKDKGYDALALFVNHQYRKGQPFMALVPFLSHRYVAVASGIGWLGWSGNLTPEYGAPVAITSIVTSTDLETDPLIEVDRCKDCHLCVAVCPSQFLNMREYQCQYRWSHLHT